MKKIIAAVLLSTAFAAPAFAADSPFYVGAMAGDAFIGIFGGYQIDKMFSVEAHYSTVLTPDYSSGGGSVKTTNSNIGVEGVALFPLNIQKVPQLSVFAKAGLERSSTKVTYTNTGSPASNYTNTTTDLKLTLGGGAQYDFNSNLSVRAGVGVMGYHNDLYVAGIYKF